MRSARWPPRPTTSRRSGYGERSPSEERTVAATAYLEANPDRRQDVAEGVAGARHFRPQTVARWPVDKLAAHVARIRPPRQEATLAVLRALHIHTRGPLMSAVLDALGVPNEGGIADQDDLDGVEIDVDRLQAAVDAATQVGDRRQVLTYLLTLVLYGWSASPVVVEWIQRLEEDDPPPPEAEPELDEAAPAPPPPEDVDEFATLDRQMIYAIVDAAQGIEGALGADAIDDVVEELLHLNGRRHRSYFHAGFRDVLFERSLGGGSPADNRSRSRWYWAGVVQGLARSEAWDRIADLLDGEAALAELGDGSDGASHAATRYLAQALFRVGRPAEVPAFVSVRSLQPWPEVFVTLLHEGTEVLRSDRAAEAKGVFDRLAEVDAEASEDLIDERWLREAKRRHAHCLRQVGEFHGARTVLEEILANDPGANETAMVHADIGLVDGRFRRLADVRPPRTRAELDVFVEALTRGLGFHEPRVGTVDKFQGQEAGGDLLARVVVGRGCDVGDGAPVRARPAERGDVAGAAAHPHGRESGAADCGMSVTAAYAVGEGGGAVWGDGGRGGASLGAAACRPKRETHLGHRRLPAALAGRGGPHRLTWAHFTGFQSINGLPEQLAMTKPYDTRLLTMVAQEPFDHDVNRFCKLVPIVYVDGARAPASDFPNDGEIWWMLTARTGPLARPGNILVGTVEDAMRFDASSPDSSQYQAERDAISELSSRDGLEVLAIGDDQISSIERLVGSTYAISMEYRPATAAMVRWRGSVYGPFKISSRETSDGSQAYLIGFDTQAADSTVLTSPCDVFDSEVGSSRVPISETVSLTMQPASRSSRSLTQKREIVLRRGLDRWEASRPRRIKVEPLELTLTRFAKKALNRTKRKELRALLEEMQLGAEEPSSEETDLNAIRRALSATDLQDRFVEEAADALVNSGLLGPDELRQARDRAAERYIRDHSATLQADVETRIAVTRSELAALEDRRDRLADEIASGRERAKHELNAELEGLRESCDEQIRLERQDLERQQSDLVQQREVIEKRLKSVVSELRDEGETVVARFLTIAPLIQAAGLTQPARAVDATPATGASGAPPVSTAASFQVPPGLLVGRGADPAPITEDEFFDRFERLVAGAGFSYRIEDLRRFHVALKTGDLTILGGPSGTGKSSLPQLYAAALRGEGSERDRRDCLVVSVSPAWTESRDLLGYLSALDGRFHPSESNLYQYLLLAAEEFSARGQSSGVYPVLLDEMNLAQVEHYFGDFLSALERRGAQRVISCFSAESVSQVCPFKMWSQLPLSPALRFVGTANFDETTRGLSDRVLDRANLMHLGSGALPESSEGESDTAAVGGREITLRDLNRWSEAVPLVVEGP